MRSAVLFAVALSACGGATSRPTPTPCEAEDAALRTASDALATCRATPPEPWRHEERYGALVASLDHYDGTLAFGDDGNEVVAEALAAELWAFLDELASDVVD